LAPELAEGVEMGRGGAELGHGEGDLAAPKGIGQLDERAGSSLRREAVGVDDETAGAIAEGSPAVSRAKDVLRGQPAGAHFFIAPEQVALRAPPLGQQAVS